MKMTVKEIANYFKISESYVRGVIYNKKKIPFTKENRKVLINLEDAKLFFEFTDKRKNSIFKRYDINIVSEWLELYKNSYSFKEIGYKYNTSGETISVQLKKKFPDFDFDDYNFKLTNEEKIIFREAKEYYYSEDNISIEKVSIKFPLVTKSKFSCYLKRTGNSAKNKEQTKGQCKNHDFFDNIDSEIKAYLLGFFAADGHIERKILADNSYTYIIKINVKLNDSHILSLFNKYLCDSKATIGVCKNKRTVWFSTTSKNIGERLLNLGYDNRKTYTCNNLPIISKNMYPHFIRGYFDGDGSASFNRRLAGNRLSGYNKIIAIASASNNILKEIVKVANIKNFTINKTNKKGDMINISNRESFATVDCNQLNITNTEDIIEFYIYLYNDANFFFKRKKDNFELCCLTSEAIEGALQGNL